MKDTTRDTRVACEVDVQLPGLGQSPRMLVVLIYLLLHPLVERDIVFGGVHTEILGPPTRRNVGRARRDGGGWPLLSCE